MAIIYLTRFPERPAPPSTTFRSRVRPEQVLRPAESGAGWGWVRLLPEGFFPLPREKRAGNPPSALSCTTWGFSCGSAYANARWALTPPFHPYPAPSSIIQHHPAPLSAGRKTCSGLTPDLKVVLDGAGMVLDGAGRYIFCDTVRHPGFTSWAPPISRGMLPSGVRTFLWQNKYQASDHPPQERVTQSEVECEFEFRSGRAPARTAVGRPIETSGAAPLIL